MPLSYQASSSSRHPSEPEQSWDARSTFSAPSTRLPQSSRQGRPNLPSASQPRQPHSSAHSIYSSGSRSHSHHPDEPPSVSAPTRVLTALDSTVSPKTLTTPRKAFMSSQSSLGSDDRSSDTQHRSSPRSSTSAISKIASAFSRSSKSKSMRASVSPTVQKPPSDIKSSISGPTTTGTAAPRRPNTAPQAPSLMTRPRTAPSSPASPSRSQFASQFHARMNFPVSPAERDTSYQTSPPRDHAEEQEPSSPRGLALKTLLSKPAIPSSSVASLHSMQSDTDNGSRTPMVPPAPPPYMHNRGARKMSAPSIDVAATPQPQGRRVNAADADIRPPAAPYMSERHSPSLESLDVMWKPQQPQGSSVEARQRNVLKRRPSGSARAVKTTESKEVVKERELKDASARVLRGVTSMEKVRDADDGVVAGGGGGWGSGRTKRSFSMKTVSPPSTSVTAQSSSEKFSSLGHSSSMSQTPQTPQHREKADRAPPPAALNLTPAGEVAQAYKQQRLSPFPRSRASAPASPSMKKPTPPTSPHVSVHSGERSPAPYYTVYGNNSGKTIRAGGPEDRWSGVERIIQSTVTISAGVGVGKTAAEKEKERREEGEGARSLTRKVSNRWKKVTGGGGVVKDESPPRPSTPSSHSRSKSQRPSLQENLPRGRSTSHSIDGYPETHKVNGGVGVKHGRAETDPTTGLGTPSRTNGKEETNGKLWKLMKRISTGALRDRFQAEKTPPPVPSIPKEYLDSVHSNGANSAPTTRSFDRPSTAQNGLSRPGIGIVTSPLTTSPPPSAIPAYGRTKRPSTAPKTIGGTPARPSFTTSSSPNSSDVASSKFFNRTHSARSSVSSYGEELPPPVPGSSMSASGHETARHIMPPHELLRIATRDEEERKALDGAASNRSRDRSPRRTISSPSEVIAPFKRGNQRDLSPMPITIPRKRENKDSTPTGSPTSPLIPKFDCANAVNSTQSLKDDTVASPIGSTNSGERGTGGLNPPPRPTRSTLRPSGTFGRTFGRDNSGSPEDGKRDTLKLERPDSRSDSKRGSNCTVRSRTKSEGASMRGERETSKKTPLTFRPLDDSSRKPPLSEKEKADIWDDLLERSAQAGGTLHIGGGGLMSDDMRLSRAMSSRMSNYSELA